MNRAGAQEVFLPDGAAGGALAGVGPLGPLRQGAAPLPGSPRPGILPRADPRGGDHRSGAQRDQDVPAAPAESLPDPDEVPRRDPSPFRGDALPGVRHEGRLQFRCRRGGRRDQLPQDVRGLQADLHACGLKFRPVEADSGSIGGSLFPRVHGDGGFRRGCDRLLHRLPVCGEPRKGRDRQAREDCRSIPRSQCFRWKRSTRRR